MSATTAVDSSSGRRARIARGLIAIYPATLVLSLALAGFVPLFFTSARRDLLPSWRPRKSVAADIAQLCRAIDEYTILNGGRPPESLGILYSEDVNGRSLLSDASVLIDPWNKPYGYEMPTLKRNYRVFTLGRDGKPGGEGDDADIDNFTIAAERKW